MTSIHTGMRVANDEGVGIVEDEGDGFTCLVRWLTPRNVPSCLVSTVLVEHLTQVDDNVIPAPKSAEWQRASDSLYNTILAAIRSMDDEK